MPATRRKSSELCPVQVISTALPTIGPPPRNRTGGSESEFYPGGNPVESIVQRVGIRSVATRARPRGIINRYVHAIRTLCQVEQKDLRPANVLHGVHGS